MLDILIIIALIIIAVLLFELIIVFHEGGHFITAKKSGVQVNEFSIGMGPKLFGFKKGETQYSFRILPIGGYCAMEGEDEQSDNPRAFTNAKIWKRMIIIVAGAFMNILLGLIMMFIMVLQTTSFSSTTVSQFSQNSYSANCGLEVGDTIVRLNNYNVYTSQDLSYAIATINYSDVDGDDLNIYKQDCALELCSLYSSAYNDDDGYSKKVLKKTLNKVTEGTEAINAVSSKKEAKSVMDEYYAKIEKILGVSDYDLPDITVKETRVRYRTDVVVERDGQRVNLENVDFYTYLESEDAEEPSVAVDFYVEEIDKNFVTVMQQTGLRTLSVIRMVWSSLVGLVTGQFSFTDVSGPVGAASAITTVASAGLESSFFDAFSNIFYMMMLISVNLGIFNMLPFPALDGGRFLFLLIEAIFRKPIPRKAESVVNGIGLAILLVFMFIITIKDVWQLLPF